MSSTLPETKGPDDHPPAGVHSLWRLRGYLRPHLAQLVVMLVCALLGVGLSIAIPLVTKAMIDGPIAHHQTGPVLPLGLLALGLGVLEAALIWCRRGVQSHAVLDVETAMRHDLYERLQALPMAFHGQWQSGQLLSRVTTDLSSIRRFFGFGMLFLLINIVQLVVTTIVLLRMYWPLGLVVAAAAVPIVMLSNSFERRYVVVSRRVQDEQGDLATLAEEGAVGVRVIRSFGRGRYVSENYDRSARKLYETSMDKVRLSAKLWTLLEAIPNVAVVVVLLLGAYGVGTGHLTLGTLVAFITLMLSLVWPIAALGFILAMAQEAMTAAARILEIFDTEPSITSGSTVLDDPRGHLRFENVSFAFPDEPDEPVLRDVNLDVAPGETVAVVGATGSGKTTLTALVPRLYDVTGGRVTIDGVDVRDLELGDLRRVVATAFEEPTLFSMSARENVTLGRADATDADIDAALEVAQAQYVHDLPWGLDTRIGEQGMSLSGGQRQRLALARAVLSEPRILVLDDTLSAL
ncbi:MAG: ABC transporter ATP-binding protein, partial [Nocardioidaceae bacterium]